MKFTLEDFRNGKVAIQGDGTQKMQHFLKANMEKNTWEPSAGRGYYYTMKEGHVLGNPGSVPLPIVQFSDLVQPTDLPKAYKGQIADFPQEVVEMMLLRQVEQGNKRDVSAFEKRAEAAKYDGGFVWNSSPEGVNFWNEVISYKKFNVFFDKYPKQQQVIYTNMNKKILGYRLKKEFHNMNEACGSITGFVDAFDFRTGTDKTEYYAVRGPEGMTTCYKALKDVGVLDLWFEPVYQEEQYKVGDWVVTSGSANGWGTGMEINNAVVQYIRDRPNSSEVVVMLNGKECHTGKSQIVRKATAAEIEEASIQVVSVGGAFNVTVKNKKVYHGSNMEDITEFVRGVKNFVDSIPKKIGSYDFIVDVDNIPIKKSGCESKKTYIKDWLSVLEHIK